MVLYENGIVNLRDHTTFTCLKAACLSQVPRTKVEYSSLVGSKLIVATSQGSGTKTVYALDVTNFTSSELVCADHAQCLCSPENVIIATPISTSKTCSMQGFRLDKASGELVTSFSEQHDAEMPQLQAVNQSCFIYSHGYSSRNFVVANCETGKRRKLTDLGQTSCTQWFMTHNLAMVFYRTQTSNRLDLYLTPFGKKITSLNLCDLGRDLKARIKQIDFQDKTLTIEYASQVSRHQTLVRGMVYPLPRQ